MIIEFTVNKLPAYVLATSVMAILPDVNRKGKSMVYMDPPVESLAIDESPEDAFALWYVELLGAELDDGDDMDEDHATYSAAADALSAEGGD